MKFRADLWKRIGEQKIDVVVKVIESDFELPIYESAKEEGVMLI